MSDRQRRVQSVAAAGYEAASKEMEKVLNEEPIEDAEATGIFATALLYPGVNYLISIGVTREEILRTIGSMVDDLEEEGQSTSTLN